MKSTRTRKEPTAEQKAAAAERREQIKGLCKILKAMPEEKRVLLAASYGIRTAEGHELSLYNQCLLIHQNDKVSVVGGFKQWKALGRSVKKGSKALAIWVPCNRAAETGAKAQTAIVPAGVDPADLDDRFFVLGNVFDISQTETAEEKASREIMEAVNTPTLPTCEAMEAETVVIADEVPALPAPRPLSPAERGEKFIVPTFRQAPERGGWQETAERTAAGQIIWTRGSERAVYRVEDDSMHPAPVHVPPQQDEFELLAA